MAHKSKAADPELNVEYVAISALIPNLFEARRQTSEQISKLARNIDEFGWSTPVVIDESGRILAGDDRLRAAQLLGMKAVPCPRLAHLTWAQKNALASADARLTASSTFDDEPLRALLIEFAHRRPPL